MDENDAAELADKRLREFASNFLDELRERFNEALPGNHSPAETILLAHLMTMTDGYNEIEYQPHRWTSRKDKGWGTTLGYLVEVGPTLVPFVFETRHDSFVRHLAILIDHQEPGTRTPRKQNTEATLLSLGYSVLLLSPAEICADIENCCSRVEKILFEMSTGVLEDAGILKSG
jgi:hypothetical protein